jgi:tripartite-type tricarboxylate transporter receptor subunit TctC
MKMFTSSRASTRRNVLAFGLASAATCALADNAPPLRILVGFPPGGSTDVIARHLALGLQKELGRVVIVENKPGAGGQLAALALKAAKADGTTLFLSNSHTVSMIPLTVLSPGFDPVHDFAPVALVAVDPAVLALSPTTVGDTTRGLREFGQWAKANPGAANVGVPAPASQPEFAVTLIARTLGINLNAVPYRGAAPMVQDVVSGQIAAGIGAIGNVLPFAQSGKLRVVAVDGSTRLPSLPEVPTFAELGVKGLEQSIFTAVYAPTGTPPDVLRTYGAAITRIAGSAEFANRLSAIGAIAATASPEELAARARGTRSSWASLVKTVGFKPQ